jgi:alcohol dehydrogenase class IV
MAKLLCAFDGHDAGGGDGPDHRAASPEDHGGGGLDDLVAAVRSGGEVAPRRRRLVLVPTTSGSGSEATHFAVVYVGEDKHSVGAASLLPDAVVLDPALALSGSAHQRATSGIDAVAQAIESLWATGADDRSRRFARHALRLLLANIEPFVLGPTQRAARGMAIGAHLAGRAIDSSKTTAAHAMSYAITKRFGVSHGHAVALTLGAFIDAHAAAAPADLQPGLDPRAHADAIAEIGRQVGGGSPADAGARFTALVERLGLTPRLSGVGVEPDDHAHLVDAVNAERLGNNPVRFDAAGLARILRCAA